MQPFSEVRKIPPRPAPSSIPFLVLAAFLRTGIAYVVLTLFATGFRFGPQLLADEKPDHEVKTTAKSLEQLKIEGRKRSRFLTVRELGDADKNGVRDEQAKLPAPRTDEFQLLIAPILRDACTECHGPETQEGNFRIDTLDPNLHVGKDIDWWTEIFAVVSKGEMPPPDSKQLSEDRRAQIVNWLADEMHAASIVRRQSASHSVFRRMTRYEANYALQDLLGLPWDFAKDLPPEPKSVEGFRNTAEQLTMPVSQLETFHHLARQALYRATVRGPQPPVHYWSVTIPKVSRLEWPKQQQQIEKLKKDLKDDEVKLKAEIEKLEESFTQPKPQTYFRNLANGRTVAAAWDYPEAKYAIAPADKMESPPSSVEELAILPAGKWLNIELGNHLPDEGTLRVRVRASRGSMQSDHPPSLQLQFGWQASNEGRALLRVGQADHPITAQSDSPQFYTWDVPLGEIYPRNSVRKSSPMGAMPNPSEYIRLVNSSASVGDIQIDYVEVQSPVYDQWPPASHRRIFSTTENADDEVASAREILSTFMRRAWRRAISQEELDGKSRLFSRLRPECDSFEEAVRETLATVLASPQFLYLGQRPAAAELSAQESAPQTGKQIAGDRLSAHELATRMSIFLWCSIPDDQLLELANNERLLEPDVLLQQVDRMLSDPKSQRMVQQFVHQWLDMELLDFLNFQQHVPHFDPLLKEAMHHEPVALFEEMLRGNESVLNFIHCDYTMANERLAKHYGLEGIYGNQFRKVPLGDDVRRGGLLTQAGLLAMNSDYPDSHPLKRGKWILVSLLNDPPPPPPPAVPQIDLTNSEIAKMTLKERIEDHRKQPACYACHLKIDPWGIAFENYDALGKWRESIGDKKVDASSELSNHFRLDGIVGLKRYLLEQRQDQFVSAMVHKTATFALGRSLKFSDKADVDEITAQVRRCNDGLKSLVTAVATSELFRTK